MRYHSLDALRAAMMLLGLVLHAGATYTLAPIGEGWPIHDPPGSLLFSLLLIVIHLFRMPAFFVVAGFFAALLYERDGAGGFLRNRARRIALPLLIFLPTALPLAALGFVFAARREGMALPAELVGGGRLLRESILGHLWFLYDLLIFYVAAVVLAPVIARIPLATRAEDLVKLIVTRPWGVLVPALTTILTLLPMTGPGLETSASLLPPPRVLVAYAVFFAFGWGVYRQRRHVMPIFGRRWKGFTVAAVPATVAYILVLVFQRRLDPRAFHIVGVTLAGLAVWLLIFAIVGLFVRFLETPRPRIRYLSDASYWMYLTHLTVISWTAGLLMRSPAHAFVKFTIVIGVTTTVTLATYRLFVRPTRLGVLLNGRRYTRNRAGV
jgi:peptidoglycan/LPS O-acetylase OafA/YrhL